MPMIFGLDALWPNELKHFHYGRMAKKVMTIVSSLKVIMYGSTLPFPAQQMLQLQNRATHFDLDLKM